MMAWAVRSSGGRASRTAHLVVAGGQTLCGWSHLGAWETPHDYSPRCERCARAESMLTARRLAADEPAPADLMDSWLDEWDDHA